MTVIDSCVIIDLIGEDEFSEPSKIAVVDCAKKGRLFSSWIVFAEVCLAFSSATDARKVFSELDIILIDLNESSLFLAAASFKKFRERTKNPLSPDAGTYKKILPDFYIGAFASNAGLPLLTRDKRRSWSTDFPALQIISP